MATSEHIYKFSISMSCGGCSSSVERVIKELNGPRLSLGFMRVSLLLADSEQT
jgi:copper chaperone CopZ